MWQHREHSVVAGGCAKQGNGHPAGRRGGVAAIDTASVDGKRVHRVHRRHVGSGVVLLERFVPQRGGAATIFPLRRH